jgi:hypothetical protein
MIKSFLFLITTSLLFAACATNKSVEAATSFAEKTNNKEETIIPGEGYANFVLEKTSQAEVEQALGKNYELIEHNSFSIELYYKALGVSFYFYQDQPEQNVFTIRFHESFKGKTAEGIAPNTTTIEDLIKIYGEPQWTSCDGCDYWSATYQGIGFIVDRDTTVPQYPLNEELHMKKIVKQIEVFVVY